MSKVRELRSLIYLNYDTEAELSDLLGWNRQKLNKITCGKMNIGLNDAFELADALAVSVDELYEIFLRHKSPKGEKNARRSS